MSDHQEKQLAIKLLESWGYSVEEIPEGGSKVADLRATLDAETLILEVKHKSDDPAETSRMERKILAGGVAQRAVPLTRRDRIRSIFAEAEKQLSSTAKEGDFRIVWLSAGGRDPSIYVEQAHRCFYGIVDLMRMESPGGDVDCYYFDFAAAYDLPNIDGLVIVDPKYMSFFVNEFSPRVDTFARQSSVRTAQLARRTE